MNRLKFYFSNVVNNIFYIIKNIRNKISVTLEEFGVTSLLLILLNIFSISIFVFLIVSIFLKNYPLFFYICIILFVCWYIYNVLFFYRLITTIIAQPVYSFNALKVELKLNKDSENINKNNKLLARLYYDNSNRLMKFHEILLVYKKFSQNYALFWMMYAKPFIFISFYFVEIYILISYFIFLIITICYRDNNILWNPYAYFVLAFIVVILLVKIWVIEKSIKDLTIKYEILKDNIDLELIDELDKISNSRFRLYQILLDVLKNFL